MSGVSAEAMARQCDETAERDETPERDETVAREEATRRDDVKRRKRLTWAMKDPSLALENGWFQDPEFCAGLLNRCDQLAFAQSASVLELAQRIVEIAEASGDPHLLHRAYGVLSHAYIATGDLYWAGRTLRDISPRALTCCPRCSGEHFQRLGDWLLEQGRIEPARMALDRALEKDGLEADVRGRIHFVRGITHHLLGERDQALADAGATLELMDLSSPRGFFLETGALIPLYVSGGEPEQDVLASSFLAAFDQRIKGERGWGDWLTRRTWADAHLHARRGKLRRALQLMNRAYVRLLADGFAREAVAVTLDLGQLRCRDGLPKPINWRAAIEAIERCLERRPDLAEEHRKGLGKILKVLERVPESAFDAMVALRRSFVAPVPGVMVERIGPRDEARQSVIDPIMFLRETIG